ncbi:MAG: hypothetical protein JNK37_10695, partial [Verrucomicrobiales bacterium]|nr:hypothetical protein [Verrucomicrobiales bacterium]
MCLAGSAIFRAEDEGGDGGPGEPEPFAFQRVESYLELSLEAPNGATDLLPGTTRPLVAAVNRIAWEIWQRPSTGESEIRNSSVTPEPGVTIGFAVTVGEGSLSMDSVTTGESGEGAIVFTAGWAPQSATVTATMAAGSTASLTFDPPGEAWAYHHSEATLTATLGSSSSPAEVPTGEARDLVATVSYVTWDVMESNYGNQRVENVSTSPADGAQVTWSVASGDGYVTGAGTAGADGVSAGSLTMGSVDSVARVDVAYATGQATSAQLLFTVAPPAPDPAETWTLDRTEMEPVMTVLMAEGGPQQPAGTAVAVTGSAQIDRWDVWVNGLGQEDRRYNYSMPLAYRMVTFTVESGDGSLSSSSVSTDGTGSFSVTYYLGSAPSRLAVAVDADPDSTVDATGALDFTIASPPGDGGGDPGNGGGDGGGDPPPWSLLRTEGEYTISGLSVDGPTYDVEAGAT